MSSCLSAALSSTLAPVSLDTGKVATTLLSQWLKCIHTFCHAVTSLTLLLQAEVKSCYGANPEQELQCTALLLALGSHKLSRQDCIGAMRSCAEGGQRSLTAQFLASPSQAQLQSLGCKWVKQTECAAVEQDEIHADRFCPAGRWGHAKAMKLQKLGKRDNDYRGIKALV